MDIRHHLIERHTNVAEIVAGRFLASHSGLDRDEVKQDAYLALIRAVDSHGPDCVKPLYLHIYERVNDHLHDAYKKQRRRQRIAPTESFGVLGLSDGDPLNSMRDLRSASSLNPRADISFGLREGLGQIRASSHIQNCPGTVFRSPTLPVSQAHYRDGDGSASDKVFYSHGCATSRERVHRIQARVIDMGGRRRSAALDGLAVAA